MAIVVSDFGGKVSIPIAVFDSHADAEEFILSCAEENAYKHYCEDVLSNIHPSTYVSFCNYHNSNRLKKNIFSNLYGYILDNYCYYTSIEVKSL